MGYLFKGTVRENLKMAAQGATDQELWAVLERTKLAEWFWRESGCFISCTSALESRSMNRQQKKQIKKGHVKISMV